MQLTPREREVAVLVCAGLDVEDISERLEVSRWTIKGHVKSIRLKLRVERMAEIPEALAEFDARV